MWFQVIAIAAHVAFYGCYVIKMMHQKKQGIQTNQLGKGKAGFVKFVEATLQIAAFLVLGAGLVSIFLGTSALGVPFRIAGAVMSIAGAAVFILAVLTMRDSWRAGVSEKDKTALVTEGIYQVSRNPAFLGFDLLYMGTLFLFFNWILFGFTVFAMLMYHLQIVSVEEEFLLAAFGDAYLQYRKKVCRYIGRRR